jgi:cell wall-associated NlpC family hydrolase
LVSVLGSVLAHHEVQLGDVSAVSVPVHVQAVDIVAVDGQAVGPSNFAARDLVTEIAALGSGVRPDEIGTPWPIQSPGFFADQSSVGRLHLAFEMPGTNSAADPASAAGGAAPYAAGAPATPGYPAAPAAAYPAGSYPAAMYPAATAATAPGAQAEQVAGALPASVNLPGGGPKVEAMVKFADAQIGKPYVYGGGHGDFTVQPGYDCSGFVSAVLHAGGYLSSPVDTTALPGQAGIESGPGKFVTIYDRSLPGHDGHVIIDINNQFYESGGMKGPWGGGAGVMKIKRPSSDYLSTFDRILHPKGL